MIAEKILAFGAHFDDIDLGVGRTLAKLSKQGKKVYKLTLTDNVTNYKDRDIVVGYESSLIQSRAACDVLGITQLENFEVAPCTELIYNKKQMQHFYGLAYDFYNSYEGSS